MPDIHAHRAVCANIRAEMARTGKTQSDVASVLGITRQGVSRRLTGQTVFNIDELARVAAYLDVTVSSLIDERASA